MSTTASFCLGCATSLPIGSYRRQLSSVATRHVIPEWRQVLSIILDREHLIVDEAEVLGDKIGFICRKCLRSYEAAKETSQLTKHMPSKPKSGCSVTDRRSALEEEDHDLMIPAKRARMTHIPQEGSSPSVQVIILTSILHCILWSFILLCL